MKKIFVLDALNFLFRSFYAIRGMKNKEGLPTNALYGFIRSIQKIISEHSPEYFIIVFDGPDNKKSRTEIYPEYKANRDGMPEELYQQLQFAKDYCDYAGLPMLCVEQVEADDTMGTIAKWSEAAGSEVVLLSSDKDLCQLVTDKISILNVHKNNLQIDAEKVKEIHGVAPNQVIDLLAIMGDTSDNIPGISGFGPKTAAKLLEEYGSLNNLLANVEQIKNVKRREKIKDEKENALISQKLATIQIDVPIPQESSYYKIKEPNVEALAKLYQEMNFSSLLKDLKEYKEEHKEEVSYICIEDEKALQKLIENCKERRWICIDTETTSLNTLQGKLVGLGICYEAKTGYYIPMNGALSKEHILQLLKPLLEDENYLFIGHNIKYDMHILQNEGISMRSIGFDTMVASHLLHPNVTRHNLDQVCFDVFGKTKISFKELIQDDKKNISVEEVPLQKMTKYCCEDVDYTFRLKETFEIRLNEMALSEVFGMIEMPLLPAIFDMERAGIFLDIPLINQLSEAFAEKLNSLEKEIHALAGEHFNIKSPKQLSEVLFEKLLIPYPEKKKKTGFSTSAKILEALSEQYPITEKVLGYRQFEKLRSTYVDALPAQVDKSTGRIHPTFNQSGTATGRLSCQNPNLQNIPIRSSEGRKIRTAFRPEKENYSYLAADYSQIELRILAHLSEDPSLTEAFHNNADIHKTTAALVFGVPLEEVTPTMRYQAKAVNFGVIYGQQAFGLSKEMNMTMKEASAFIQTYFLRYPKVKEFLDKSISLARNVGYTQTLLGRKRPLDDINASNKLLRAQAERFAVNTPIQGTQADIMKLAMIEIQKKLCSEGVQSKMILQIHDELIFECPNSEIEKIKIFVLDIMEQIYPMKVPLKVDIAIGKNWGEC